jgi:hypothetical protein
VTDVDDALPNCYVLVCGLPRPSAEVALSDGLTLRPLSADLSVFDLAGAGASGFREWALLEPIAAACTSEIESATDATAATGYDTLNRAWLASTLLCLRGYTRHLCVAFNTYSWNLIAGHRKRSAPEVARQIRDEGVDAAVHRSTAAVPTFGGHALDFHIRILSNSAAKTGTLEPLDVAWINTHFATANRLAAESVPFRLALEAGSDWRYAHNLRGGVARLWSGIESLFGIESELTYRLAAYGASLLEPRGPKRKQRFSSIKKLYNLRSKAVHGAALSDDQLQSALDDSFSFLAALLDAIIVRRAVVTQDELDNAVLQ